MDVTSIDLRISSSQHWQESLRIIEDSLSQNGVKLNYASIARKAGIKSRSYIRMLFRGEKNPSLQSLDSILSALKTSATAKKFVLLQWQIDQRSEGPSGPPKMTQQLEKLRAKLKAAPAMKTRDQVYSVVDAPVVFASLGTTDVGSSVREILAKTNLPVARIERAVTLLVREGAARLQGDRVVPAANQLVMESAQGGDFFQAFYTECLKKGLAASHSGFSDQRNLFSAFSVSIDSSLQKQHADRFYKLLVDFLAEIEDPYGDKVVIMNAALCGSE